MKTRLNVHYYFTLLLSAFSIIQVYYASIVGVSLSLAIFLLIAILPICILGINLSKIKLDKDAFILFIFVSIHFLLVVLLNNSSTGTVVSTINFIFVLFILSVIVPNIYDKNLATRMLLTISLISSMFLIFQYVFLHVFNLYISGQLFFLEHKVSVMGHVRPFSLFSEPSAFGFFNAFGLSIALNSEKMKKRNLIVSIISLAMLLSLSTTSIGLLILVWLRWKTPRISFRKIKISGLFYLILVILLLIMGLQLNIFDTIYEHSFKGLFSGAYAGGLKGRIGNLSYAWQYHSNIVNVFFGAGVVDLDMFLPAIARIYVYYGLIGYLVFGVFFARFFMYSSKFYRTFILIPLISSFFSDSIFGIQMLLYMPLVISYKGIKTDSFILE